MSQIFTLLLICISLQVRAQIPPNVPYATTEFGNIRSIANLQLNNIKIINDASTPSSKKGRVNAWRGVNLDAIIGNYPSDYSKMPAGNELWTFYLYSDGRFEIRPSNNASYCLTYDSETSVFSQKEFGRPGKKVYLAYCSKDIKGQLFFLQESIANSADTSALSFVIRSIDLPNLCLATMSNAKKPDSLSPLTMQDCAPNISGIDRWRIRDYADIQSSKTNYTLHQMASLFALYNYSRIDISGSSVSYYNKSITAVAQPNTLSFTPVAYYRKLPFISPFDNRDLDVFYNATSVAQEFHVERFKVDGFDKSIELGTKISLPIVGWNMDAKGKLDFKSSSQMNTKLWLTVPAYTAVWFTSALTKVNGTYDIEITTDLGDSWRLNGINFKQEVVNTLIVCFNSSTDPACIQSAYSSD